MVTPLLHRVRTDTVLLTRLCLANLVANTAIVVTGAAVRLTGSGLGCPTWPTCTEDSLVNTAEYGVHGYIEFGNRLLTPVLGLIALLCLVAVLLARPRRITLVVPAAITVAGVAAQAVVGGLTVRLHLQPYAVGLHFLLSMGLMYVTYALWHRSREGDNAREWQVAPQLRALVRGIVGVTVTVLVVGTIVTGAGPHAGDTAAGRNGLDPATTSQIHADLVFLLVGLTIGGWVALRAVGAPRTLSQAALALLITELSQGLIGFVQYATQLPALVVGAHVAGSCAVWIAACVLLFRLRVRPAPVAAVGRPRATDDSGGSKPAEPVSGPAELTAAG